MSNTTPTIMASLNFPARTGFILAALDYTETLSRELGFNQNECRQIRLAVEELLDFVKSREADDRASPDHVLCFEARADGLVIRLTTRGLPFDIEKLPEFIPADEWDNISTDGLNLYLIQNFMDRVVFQNRGREGIEAELLKYRSGSHVNTLVSWENNERAAYADADIIKISGLSIRPAEACEALEISRCAYFTYGHTYEDFIYYPERIIEMNRSGELHSLVAISPDNTVMGHCALKFAPGRSDRAELGVFFVRPEYRSQGVGKALWNSAVELGRKLRLKSIYARSVTGHKGSQVLAENSGFTDCSLFLAQLPRDVDLRQLRGTLKGKMNVMLQWLRLQPPRPRLIAPPACYADIVRELYESAGIPVSIMDATTQQSHSYGEPRIHVHQIPVLNVGIIELESLHSDASAVAEWVNVHTRRLCREKLDAIYLFLNIEQACAAQVAENCRENGYIFSGIQPDAFSDGDALALQYMNLPENPFEHLAVKTKTACLLRDFIGTEWLKKG